MLRKGGAPVLRRETVASMTSNQIGDYLIDPNRPGWGFGFGAAILKDPIAAQTPKSVGTYSWGGVYGHSWFVDPQLELSVVGLTKYHGRRNGWSFSIGDPRCDLPGDRVIPYRPTLEAGIPGHFDGVVPTTQNPSDRHFGV